MFSCEYFEISKSTCFEEYLRTVASDVTLGGHPQMNIVWDFLNPLSPLLFSELYKQNFKSLIFQQSIWKTFER